MKKTQISKLVLLVIFSLLLFVFTACSNDEPASSPDSNNNNEPAVNEDANESYHFIFVPKLIHPWYESVRAGALGAIAELEEQGIKITFEWDPPPQADIIQHSQKVETGISKKPDAIAVAALDPAVTTPIINQAVANGVNVITFEADASESDRLLYVGNNQNEKDGEVLAELLAEKLNYEGEVAILLGSLGAPSHRERVEGFKRVMDKYPGIKIVAEQADNDDVVRAAELTEAMIQANPNLKGIFANNAANPIGAAQAVSAAGKQGEILIVGMDDDPETIRFLEEGVITGIVVQDVPEIGYEGIFYMLELARGNEVPEIHSIDSYIVTLENIDEWRNKQKEYEKFFELLK